MCRLTVYCTHQLFILTTMGLSPELFVRTVTPSTFWLLCRYLSCSYCQFLLANLCALCDDFMRCKRICLLDMYAKLPSNQDSVASCNEDCPGIHWFSKKTYVFQCCPKSKPILIMDRTLSIFCSSVLVAVSLAYLFLLESNLYQFENPLYWALSITKLCTDIPKFSQIKVIPMRNCKYNFAIWLM